MNALFFLVLFLLGAAVGSFILATATRLTAGETLRGRSHCAHCRRTLCWYELIPVASWCWLQGRCRTCQHSLGLALPFAEITLGILFVLAGQLAPSLAILGYWLISLTLAAILFLCDWKHSVLPDQISLPWLVFALLVGLGFGPERWSILIGGVVGAGFFALQYIISRGRWVGDGDIRLGAIMGLMLGWPLVLLALLIAYVTGAIVGLGLIALRRVKFSSAVPFGVFLIPALFITLWWGNNLVRWYVSLW